MPLVLAWTVVFAAYLSLAMPHPHEDAAPNRPFAGVKALKLSATHCRPQFTVEARKRGFVVMEDQGPGVDELVVVGTASPSGDWLLSVYLLRPGVVGFPQRHVTTVAAWWHHSMFEGKPPTKKECRWLAGVFGEASVTPGPVA